MNQKSQNSYTLEFYSQNEEESCDRQSGDLSSNQLVKFQNYSSLNSLDSNHSDKFLQKAIKKLSFGVVKGQGKCQKCGDDIFEQVFIQKEICISEYQRIKKESKKIKKEKYNFPKETKNIYKNFAKALKDFIRFNFDLNVLQQKGVEQFLKKQEFGKTEFSNVILQSPTLKQIGKLFFKQLHGLDTFQKIAGLTQSNTFD